MITLDDLTLLTQEEAASLISQKVSYLQRLRAKRSGPRYIRMSGRVLYDRAAVVAWIKDLFEEPAPKHRAGSKGARAAAGTA